MTWFKVDDGFVEHRKLRALERDPRAWADALAVWLAAGVYCSRNLTDGHVDAERLARATPLGKRAIRVADRLVECGLWERAEGGYQFHDWADWQPTRAEIDGDRKRRSEQRRGAANARWDAARIGHDHAVPHRTADAPVPTRPDPSDPDQEEQQQPAAAADALESEARGEVVRAYCAAYEARFKQAFMGNGADYSTARSTVARWIVAEHRRGGRPIGEIAAACVAGLFAAKDKPRWSWFAEDPAEHYRAGTGNAAGARLSEDDFKEEARKLRIRFDRKYHAAGSYDEQRAAEAWWNAEYAALSARKRGAAA